MSYKFSIVTVCHNSEKTIEKTINSLLNQSYTEFEWIVIDGKSSDTTLEIIDKYKEQFKSIKVLSESDKGIYDAMNKGIKLSNGELIAFLNSDDYYENDTLDIISKNYDKSIDVIYGDCKIFEIINNKRIEYIYKLNTISDLKQGISLPHPSTFVKREILLKKMFDDKLKIAADYKLFLQLYIDNYVFSYIPYKLTNMQYGGVSSKQHAIGLKENIQIREELVGYTGINFKKEKIKLDCKSLFKKFLITIVPSKFHDEYIIRRRLKSGWVIIGNE